MPRSPVKVTAGRVTRSLKQQVSILGTAIGVVWVTHGMNLALGGVLFSFGIIPRTAVGLRGLLFAPFLHANTAHLMANTLPFVMLGWLVMLRDARHFVPVTLYAMLGSGLAAWLLGAPGSVHIGASGVIFGYLGFLLLGGWYARSAMSIALSLLVTAVWGTLVLGVVPGEAGISWQAHLGGVVAGVLAARSYRKR